MNVEAISGFETAGLTLPQAAQAVDNRDGRRTGESPRCREERIYQARTASAGVSEGCLVPPKFMKETQVAIKSHQRLREWLSKITTNQF